jgi:hypothetical protein
MWPCHPNVVFSVAELTRELDHRLQVRPRWTVTFPIGPDDATEVDLVPASVTDNGVGVMGRSIATCVISSEQVLVNHAIACWEEVDLGVNVSVVRNAWFAYDYAQMRADMEPMKRELLAHVMHPSRLPGIGFMP